VLAAAAQEEVLASAGRIGAKNDVGISSLLVGNKVRIGGTRRLVWRRPLGRHRKKSPAA